MENNLKEVQKFILALRKTGATTISVNGTTVQWMTPYVPATKPTRSPRKQRLHEMVESIPETSLNTPQSSKEIEQAELVAELESYLP